VLRASLGEYCNPGWSAGDRLRCVGLFGVVKKVGVILDEGRFLSKDPAKDGVNWFAFVGNDHLAFVDPTGLIQVESATLYNETNPIKEASTSIIDPTAPTVRAYARNYFDTETRSIREERLPAFQGNVEKEFNASIYTHEGGNSETSVLNSYGKIKMSLDELKFEISLGLSVLQHDTSNPTMGLLLRLQHGKQKQGLV
jgi:hypothetical protein